MSQSITLSWKGRYTAQESSENRIVVFKRYPKNNNSAVVQIGSFVVIPNNPKPFYQNPCRPLITVSQSASVISEPAITIQDVTKQDEAFYRIEVNVGAAVVANHTIFLKVFGSYVHLLVMLMLY